MGGDPLPAQPVGAAVGAAAVVQRRPKWGLLKKKLQLSEPRLEKKTYSSTTMMM
jgi:hypothetical protein